MEAGEEKADTDAVQTRITLFKTAFTIQMSSRACFWGCAISFPLPHYIILQGLHSSNILEAISRTVLIVESVNTDAEAELIPFMRGFFLFFF